MFGISMRVHVCVREIKACFIITIIARLAVYDFYVNAQPTNQVQCEAVSESIPTK